MAMMYRGGWHSREPVERPKDKEVRRANLRRIARLFRPYWLKLVVVTVLILVAAGLGVIPACRSTHRLRPASAPVSTALRNSHADRRPRALRQLDPLALSATLYGHPER